MKKHLLSTLCLTAVAFGLGSGNYALAQNPWDDTSYTEVFKLDFEDADTYNEGWTFSGGNNYQYDNGDGTHSLHFDQGGGAGDRNAVYTFTDSNFSNAECFKFDFSWGTACSNKQSSTLTISDPEGATIIKFTQASFSPSVTIQDKENNQLGTFTADGYTKIAPKLMAHITLKSSKAGTFVSIWDGNRESILNEVKLSNDLIHINKLTATAGRAVSQMRFDDVILSTKESTETYASYTINWEDEKGTVIKTTEGTGIVGDVIELASSDQADIFNADNTIKYTYVSDDSEGKTIAADGSTVVTIVMKELLKLETSIVAKDQEGNEIGKYSVTMFEGEQTTLYYNKYIKVEEQYFVIEKNSKEPYYGIVLNAGDSKTITYSPSDICYFAEIEDLTPSSSKAYVADGATTGRYSNGAAKRLGPNSYTKLNYTSEVETIYEITLWARNQSSSQNATLNVNCIDADGNKQTLDCTFPEWNKSGFTTKSVQFTLPAQCTPIIENATEWNSNLEMDYVTLTKLGETSKTITPSAATEKAALNGMLSFYDNNIAYQIAGATAYYATKSGDASVSLVEISDGIIPAKCGVIIQGTPGEAFTMTATTTEATYADNVLTGVPAATAATSINADGVYVLGLDSNNANPALYRFKDTLSPSKAYVDPSIFGGAAAPMIRIAATTTAINAIESVEQNSQVIYDLNGRRSSSLNKGLNLVNGKKVMIK